MAAKLRNAVNTVNAGDVNVVDVDAVNVVKPGGT